MTIEFLDHTADIRIRIVAENYKQLFKEAAKAIFEFIAPRACVEKNNQEKRFLVEIQSLNTETLLVDFLSEVLYYIEVYYFVVCEVNIIELREDYIKAELVGYEYDDDFEEHIKAITYEGLSVSQKDGKIEVEITFDI